MAAPAEMTTLAMTGHFTMNKALSNDSDLILRLQGVSWFTRKAIGLATVHLHYTHYSEPPPTAPVDISSLHAEPASPPDPAQLTDPAQHAEPSKPSDSDPPDQLEHIDIFQSLSGGIGGTREHRILDWAPHPHEDDVFGAVTFRSRRVFLHAPPPDITLSPFLVDGWAEDVIVHGAVYTVAESDEGWRAEQLWGFELVDGARRHVRHVDFTGPQRERVQARLVYDYHAPVPA